MPALWLATGNFPDSCRLEVCSLTQNEEEQCVSSRWRREPPSGWRVLLPPQKVRKATSRDHNPLNAQCLATKLLSSTLQCIRSLCSVPLQTQTLCLHGNHCLLSCSSRPITDTCTLGKTWRAVGQSVMCAWSWPQTAGSAGLGCGDESPLTSLPTLWRPQNPSPNCDSRVCIFVCVLQMFVIANNASYSQIQAFEVPTVVSDLLVVS